MRVRTLIRWSLRLALAGLFLGAVGLAVIYYLYARDLPDVETLNVVQLEVPLRVYTEAGSLMGVFGERRRQPVAFDDIPPRLINAFLAGEDARFFEHPGVDWQGLSRAVIHLIRTGDKSQGGSTITQQLARNFFLSFEKTYTRKAKEFFLALKIEREISKEKILELYLNKIFLGHRAYGVGAAAQVYYGKTLDELSLAQTAMIAALPKAPSRINPISQPERAIERRNYVLGRMLELGFVSQAEYQEAIAEKDLAFYHGPTLEVDAPFVAEMVRAEAIRLLGNAAYSGGFDIRTTLDGAMQNAANRAVRKGLFDYDQRHGYRGPEAAISMTDYPHRDDWHRALQGYRPLAGLVPGLVVETDAQAAMVYLQDGQSVLLDLQSVSWARPFISRDEAGEAPQAVDQVVATGDIIRLQLTDEGQWRLAQFPEAEAALVSLDPETGAIRALVGGFEFQRSKFNRVVQGRRQPGSSFKPFVYSAALEKGYTTASMVNDAPVVFHDPIQERTWKPQNFSEQFYGPTRLREAMVNSRNLVSIRLLEDIGIEYARGHISRFGFEREELPPDLSMSLGSATLTPLSVARGYAVFANGGYLITPHFIKDIRNADGDVIYEADQAYLCRDCAPYQAASERPEQPDRLLIPLNENTDDGEQQAFVGPPVPNTAPRAISAQNAYLVRSMMMDVIRRGTGRKAQELGRHDLAGKTGTTNDQHDAWFSGYNETLVTTVWVGFDDYQPLGRTELGGKAALPIWMDLMETALTDVPDREPELPQGLAQVRINPESGLLAAVGSPHAMMEVFRLEHIPETETSVPSAQVPEEEEDPYDLF